MTDDQKKCFVCASAHSHVWCKIKILLILIILILLGIFLFAPHERSDRQDQQNTITVNGSGEITAQPDMATVSFSVTEEDMDVSKASNEVNTKIGTVVNALQADGIDATDIKTTDYSITPQYNYVNTTPDVIGTQTLAGYDVTDSITVNIKNLANVDKVITDLSNLGVTNMSGLTFTNSNYNNLVIEARDQAIAQARTEAAGLAQSLGVKLDKIVGYSDNSSVPVFSGPVMATPMAAMSTGANAVIPTGEDKITENISITYEIQQ